MDKNRASLNRSTTSWHDSWNKFCLSNFLNTDPLISAKLLEISKVNNAYRRGQEGWGGVHGGKSDIETAYIKTVISKCVDFETVHNGHSPAFRFETAYNGHLTNI